METISDGVHIFGRLQGKAVDSHFIYLEISPEQDFATLLKELKVNNGFHERLVFRVLGKKKKIVTSPCASIPSYQLYCRRERKKTGNYT